MDVLSRAAVILGRFFLSLPFFVSGANKIFYWNEEEKRLMNVIADWQTYTVSSEWLQSIFSLMAIWIPCLLMGLAVLEILGAILLVTGYREKFGALLLAATLFVTAVLVDHFWFSESAVKDVQFAFFLRDLAILGGLMIFAMQRSDREIEVEEFREC